ncbi:FHA domain-containing protein [Nocardia arizonensis]|uniref:FHA domain-containing protein n=1 Tax=Nocardia arizonensis TaxID=1141647 RepID=UPI0006D126ED|nr:FHA domain-containing protein [Nocardia arizonensis]
MRTNPSTVGIAPGDGLIARFDAVVVYLAGETASTDRILGAIEAVADADHPGAAIAQRLAAVVFAGGSEPPPFGVLAPTSDGTVILLRGPVIAEIHGAEGVRTISGARAFTWVDEIVREPVRRIAIGSDTGAALTVHPRTDLRAGVVPGGGFELRIAARRSGKSSRGNRPDLVKSVDGADEPAPTAPAGFEVIDDAADERPPRANEAGHARSAGHAPLERTRTDHSIPEVERSSADRSGTPRTAGKPAQPRRISEGGSAATPRTAEPVGTKAMSQPWPHTPAASRSSAFHTEVPPDDSRTRPARPSGVIAKSDGTTAPGALVYDETAYPLDRPYVIGRAPAGDESVRTAVAAPLSVPRDRHVSRIHAFVTVERGKVYVCDAGTPAGTYIAAPGADSWTRIGTSASELAPGWSIRIGEKVLITYRAEDISDGPTASVK